MSKPSKAASEAAVQAWADLERGKWTQDDRDRVATIIDRAIQEAAKPLVEAATAVKVSLNIVETSKDKYLVTISEEAASELIRAIGALRAHEDG